MLIILEGPDGAGKSTVAERLTRLLRLRYPGDKVDLLHARPPRRHPLDEYVAPLTTYRPNSGVHVICDRWHWGEIIYPKVLKRDTSYTSAVHRFTEMFLLSRGAVVVHVTADVSTLRSRIEQRGDDLITSDMVPTLRSGYASLARLDTHLPTLTRTSSLTTAQLANIVTFAETSATRASRLNMFTTYVGAPTVRYLLLGDVRGTLNYPYHPAFMPYPGRSGDFLLKNFRALTDDVHVGIGNACDVDDPYLLWRTVGYPRVLALGQNAAAALSEIPHMIFGAVPHPQYVRRFHSRDGVQYGEAMLRSLYAGSNHLNWRPTVARN